jgi:hypothetical protein
MDFSTIFNETYGALDFRGRVRGKGTDASFAEHFPLTMDDLAKEVAKLPNKERVRGLILAENAIDELDFPLVKKLLEQHLPRVEDLNLSLTALSHTSGKDMQVLTRMPQLQTISIVGTVVAGFLGYEMREQLEEQDIRKLVFMTPAMLLSGAHERIVPPGLVAASLETHMELYRAAYEASKREPSGEPDAEKKRPRKDDPLVAGAKPSGPVHGISNDSAIGDEDYKVAEVASAPIPSEVVRLTVMQQ